MRVFASIALLLLTTASEAREPSQKVPFVGCPSDGQLGPRAGPKKGNTPALPARESAQLAYYADDEGLGVLAPRGWHCFALLGSDGSLVIVTPERHVSDDFIGANTVSFRGPAIQISYSTAGTSGRLAVMPVIVRYFPRYLPFVREMKDLDLDFEALTARPYRNDITKSRTANYFRFTTPAHRTGEGTNSRLLPGNLPIEGSRKIVGSASEPDMLSLEVRLPPQFARLADTILDNAK